MGRERLRAGRVSAKAIQLDTGASRRVTGAVLGVGRAAESKCPFHERAFHNLDNANGRRAHTDAAPVPLDNARVLKPLETTRGVAKGVTGPLGELAGRSLDDGGQVGARVVREDGEGIEDGP